MCEHGPVTRQVEINKTTALSLFEFEQVTSSLEGPRFSFVFDWASIGVRGIDADKRPMRIPIVSPYLIEEVHSRTTGVVKNDSIDVEPLTFVL